MTHGPWKGGGAKTKETTAAGAEYSARAANKQETKVEDSATEKNTEKLVRNLQAKDEQ